MTLFILVERLALDIYQQMLSISLLLPQVYFDHHSVSESLEKRWIDSLVSWEKNMKWKGTFMGVDETFELRLF